MKVVVMGGILLALSVSVASAALLTEEGGWRGDRRDEDFVSRPSITLFERPGFQGKSRTWSEDMSDLGSTDFNDHAASVQVHGRWRVCANSEMRGRCQDVTRDIPDLRAVGLDHQISSFAYTGPRPQPVLPPPPAPTWRPDDRDGSLQGRTAALFRRPVTAFGPVPSRPSEADAYCRSMGYAISLYADYSGPELRDLVCRR